MNSRREFLRTSAVVATTALGGCIDNLEGKISSGAAWPPPKPLNTPDIGEIPNLDPPTWGKSGVPHVFIYNDMATSQAGKVFHREWQDLVDSIKQGHIQVSFCDYPLPSNDWSYPLAIAARSVQYHVGNDAFLTFIQHVLRDFMPDPYLTKQRVLDAAETVGAPRNAIKEDTESWKFYPLVERSYQKGEERGIRNSVSRSIIEHEGKKSRPIITSSQKIIEISSEMEQSD